MDAREKEQALLYLCLEAATNPAFKVTSAYEANVFRVASGLAATHRPGKAEVLHKLSREYFDHHPEAELGTRAILARRWVPRFRARLDRVLAGFGFRT